MNRKAKSPVPNMIHRVIGLLDFAMEALLLAMVCVSPWALGAVGALPEFWLLAAIGLLLILWAMRAILEPRPGWKRCPVAMCLAAIVLLGTLQLLPISKAILGSVSPGTARFYDRLLPAQPEILAQDGNVPIEAEHSVGSTISLYPGATRQSLVPLLAGLGLFLFVRNNLASAAAVRRLSIALFINGAALALFGLIRFFSASHTSSGFAADYYADAMFGTFINRNHFAFYINLCIGAGVGLLLARGAGEASLSAYHDATPTARLMNNVHGLMADPVSLWMCGGLALMFSSLVFCLSRGGFLAMLGAALACVLLSQLRGARNYRLLAVALSLAASLALLVWFGLAQVEARLGTLVTGEAIRDGRVFVLTHAWPLIQEFPLLGTGYGTFQFVEPLQLHTAADVGTIYEHAHNDYLEDLIEGGIVRLAIRVLAIAIIFRFADRAFRAHMGAPTAALVLGLLYAFTSIVIHSFFEFGLYVPSIVVLAVVVCAHLCSLGEPTAARGGDAPDAQVTAGDALAAAPGFRKLASVAGLLLAVAFGWFFCSEGWKAVRIDDWRTEARRLRRAAGEGTVARAAEIPLLESTVSLEPSDAERRFLLGEAYLDVFKQQLGSPRSADRHTASSANRYLSEGLRHVVAARNLCPLLPEPHTRIASYVEAFASADPRSAYMARAKFLAPADPQLWYLCGLQELADGEPERAWESWQGSLRLSDRFLTRILDRAATRLSGDEISKKILPDRPDILLSAAQYLYPASEALAERHALLERALATCESSAAALTPPQWHTKAMLYAELGQPTAALQAYRRALEGDPRQIAWRYELAEQLRTAGRAPESRRELGIILSQQPDHAQAQKLMAQLNGEDA